MSTNHDNIYNILSKLNALTPQEPKQDSMLKNLEVSPLSKTISKLNESYAAEKQLDELSPKTLGSYAKKASVDAKFRGYNAGAADWGGDEGHAHPSKKEWPGRSEDDKAHKRLRGVDRAVDKMVGDSAMDEAGVPDKSWVKDPADPASKIPAYQRKANEPGRQASQARADKMNANVGAKVFRGRGEQDMAEGEKVPTKTGYIHKGTYGSEYNAGDDDSGEQGKSPKKEKKAKAPERVTSKAWKHKDGRATNEGVDEKDCTCDQTGQEDCPVHGDAHDYEHGNRHYDAIPHPHDMGKDYLSYESINRGHGSNSRLDEYQSDSKGSYVNKGKYGTEYNAGDDDSGKEGKKEKKAKAPERTTSKAWKHKGERKVKESININTVVEDTMAELESLIISEKVKNPYAIGMAAAKKKAGYGKKPAHDLPKSVITKGHEIAKSIPEDGCNHTMEGEMCPVHGMSECSGMYEGKKVDQNGDGKNDFKDVQIARYKASGMSGEEAKKKVAEDFANTPNPKYASTDAIEDQGSDLNRKKGQDPKTANKAANPMAKNEITESFKRMYQHIIK